MPANRAARHSALARVSDAIVMLRGHRVLLDATLAILYGVEVRALNQAVRRNRIRFPSDFMLELTPDEAEALRSQSVILKTGRGRHSKYLPHAFTEQGVAMLSSVLSSKRAALVNIEIMRAFVQLRQFLSSNAELARKLAALEKRYDSQFGEVFQAIRQLMSPPALPAKRIGYRPSDSAMV
jgi:hypothetical protein